MAEDGAHLAALKRQHAYLKDAGADQAKLNEVDLALRAQGIDPDELDKPKAKKEAVPERHEPIKHTAEETKTEPKRGPGRPRASSKPS